MICKLALEDIFLIIGWKRVYKCTRGPQFNFHLEALPETPCDFFIPPHSEEKERMVRRVMKNFILKDINFYKNSTYILHVSCCGKRKHIKKICIHK